MYGMPTGSSRADSPGLHFLRIRPHQIAERTLVRDLLRPRNHAHLVQRSDLRTQATVHTQDLAVDDGPQGHEVEDLAACLPDGGVAVFLEALLVESVYLGDLTGLVVPADQRYTVWISMEESQHV